MAHEKPSTSLAFVLLGDTRFPSALNLREAIRARLGDEKALANAISIEQSPFLFFIDGMMCTLMFIDAPAPFNEIDPSIGFAWYWPEVKQEIKKQKAHIVISVGGSDDAQKQSVLLGHLAAACAQTSPAPLALYWCAADALWPAAMIDQLLPPGNELSLITCVSVKIALEDPPENPPKITGFTQGLSVFGQMEVEAEHFTGYPVELMTLVLDFAAYVLSGTKPIRDGDTIGENEQKRIVVRIAPAKYTASAQSYHLQLSGITYRDFTGEFEEAAST